MKKLSTILKSKPVFLNCFDDEDGVLDQFEVGRKEARGVKVLFASYGQGSYSGEAWVLFKKAGILYEVSGSHCSCMGLEGQWAPEESLLEELEHRVTVGCFGGGDYSDNIFKDDLMKFLGVKPL